MESASKMVDVSDVVSSKVKRESKKDSGKSEMSAKKCKVDEKKVDDNSSTDYSSSDLDLHSREYYVNVLRRRQHQMRAQLRDMNDTLARYEDAIERIRDGGDHVLARRCIESIICGNDDWMLDDETVVQDEDHTSKSQTENQSSSSKLSGNSGV